MDNRFLKSNWNAGCFVHMRTLSNFALSVKYIYALVGVYFCQTSELLYLLHVTRGFFAQRTLPDGVIWKSFLAASLPLVLIALLIVKLVFVLR